ncbi:MAG: methionyl-tRNA formyltransferase [Kofleriaceae bacterium]
MRVIFMGSPAFAVPCLEQVAAHHEVVLVVTQPDKPAGRGGQLSAPPVKVAAQALGLPVIAPRTMRTEEIARELATYAADVAVVVAYGKILPRAILELFPRGCVNVHGSILPRYRGAAPVQRAVMAGDEETGVTIMMLDEGMDTGPALLTRPLAIGPAETSGELLARMAPVGAAALVEALALLAAGEARPVEQDHARATHAAMLAKEEGEIDFTRPARLVSAQIRGVDPWPGAFARLVGAEPSAPPLKVFGAVVAASGEPGGAPGEVLEIGAQGARVACGEGSVWLRELQVPGRKRMAAAQLAAGRGLAVGQVFGARAGAAAERPR